MTRDRMQTVRCRLAAPAPTAMLLSTCAPAPLLVVDHCLPACTRVKTLMTSRPARSHQHVRNLSRKARQVLRHFTPSVLQLAQTLSSLDGPVLEGVLQIIREGTNLPADGEIELDFDSLSHVRSPSSLLLGICRYLAEE